MNTENNQITDGEVPVNQVLDNAKHLETVLVIGYEPNGELYLASSTGDAMALNYMVDVAKQEILKQGEEN